MNQQNDLELLNNYLDRLITLKNMGQRVEKEINAVIDRINEVLGFKEKVIKISVDSLFVKGEKIEWAEEKIKLLSEKLRNTN